MKCAYRIIVIILLCIMIPFFSVKAEEDELDLGEYVFFDPVSDSICNQTNYWLYFNQDTTCYRWNVLNINGKNITIMLDHNVGLSNYNNYNNVLTDKTRTWSKANNIDLVDENTILRIIKETNPPTLNNTVIGDNKPNWLGVNNLVYNNRQKENSVGYWTKDSYDNG